MDDGTQRPFSAIKHYQKSGPLSSVRTMDKHNNHSLIDLSERRKRGRVRAEHSDPKRTKESLDAGYP